MTEMEFSSFMLTVVRHGETDHNLSDVLTSNSNVPLNVTGIRQANLVGLRLKDEKFSKIYSSHLLRTQETAKWVFENSDHKQILPNLTIDERIREREMKNMEDGISESDLVLEAYRWGQKEKQPLFRYDPEGAETYVDLKNRVTSFFSDLCETHLVSESSDENVLIVSHEFWIVSLVDHLMTSDDYTIDNAKSDIKKIKAATKSPLIQNTAVAKFRISHQPELEKRIVEILTYNDHSHLQDESQVETLLVSPQ